MTTTATMTDLLRAIAAGEPAAWYPSEHARSMGKQRDEIDEPLNRLRVAGLVRMTDWEAGKGQGYFLTPEGRRALSQPERLERQPEQPQAQPVGPRFRAVTDDTTITRLLMAAQIGVFILGMAQAIEQGIQINAYLGYGDSPLVRALAVSKLKLLQGAWWTLMSYALVHAGLMHLGCNLLGHYYDGSLLERLIGRVRYLTIYLIAVLYGGVGAVMAAPNAITVGSSGGLCGIFAAQFVWFITQRHMFQPAEWNNLTRHYMRVILLVVIISAVPGVSWGGHLGGAIGGALTCALIRFANRVQGPAKWLAWLAIGLLPVAAVGAVWWWINR